MVLIEVFCYKSAKYEANVVIFSVIIRNIFSIKSAKAFLAKFQLYCYFTLLI